MVRGDDDIPAFFGQRQELLYIFIRLTVDLFDKALVNFFVIIAVFRSGLGLAPSRMAQMVAAVDMGKDSVVLILLDET